MARSPMAAWILGRLRKLAALCAVVVTVLVARDYYADYNAVSPRSADVVGAGRLVSITQRSVDRTPVKHVYFLKMHKCASSTVQRIVLLRGLKYNLTFVLPLNNRNLFFPKPFHPNLAKRTVSYPLFDIMAVHSRFTVQALSYMPRDTIYVSIVRDPADQLQSSFEYFYIDACRGTGSFENLMTSDLRQYNERIAYSQNFCKINMLRNMQLYDFGIDLPAEPTTEIIRKAINSIDNVFHFVIVVEMMDESLILMRDLLKWTTDDMVYFKTNFRVKAKNQSESVRQAAYQWNWADNMLYQHFRSKMSAAIKRQEDYVQSEVSELRKRQSAMFDYCIDSRASSEIRQRPDLVMVGTYMLTANGTRNETCRRLAMPEQYLINMINDLRPEISTVRNGLK